MTDRAHHKERKSILNLYALCVVSVLLSLIPSLMAAGLSVAFFIGCLIYGCTLKKDGPEGSFIRTHAEYVVRTLWVAASVAVMTTIAAAIYLLGDIHYSAFEPCANALAARGPQWVESAGVSEVLRLIDPCLHGFIEANTPRLIVSAIIAGGPVLAYLAYRVNKGLKPALKNEPLAQSTDWL